MPTGVWISSALVLFLVLLGGTSTFLENANNSPLSLAQLRQDEYAIRDVHPTHQVISTQQDVGQARKRRPRPSQQPPVPHARTVVREGIVRLPSGTTVSAILHEVYGPDATLARDLVREFNPHIPDLDQVMAGATLWLPPVAERTRMRRLPDGSYMLVLNAFFSFAEARRYVRNIHDSGYSAEIVPHAISPSQTLYRVQLQDLSTHLDAQTAWQRFRVMAM